MIKDTIRLYAPNYMAFYSISQIYYKYSAPNSICKNGQILHSSRTNMGKNNILFDNSSVY